MWKFLKYLELPVILLVVAGVAVGLDFSYDGRSLNGGKFLIFTSTAFTFCESTCLLIYPIFNAIKRRQ